MYSPLIDMGTSARAIMDFSLSFQNGTSALEWGIQWYIVHMGKFSKNKYNIYLYFNHNVNISVLFLMGFFLQL
jgi:hypothetical protein